MIRKWYAATLIGDIPMATHKVFSFRYQSQRNQWVKEKGVYTRVSLCSRLAKKYGEVIEIDFQNVNGRWDWVYNGIRAYWLAV